MWDESGDNNDALDEGACTALLDRLFPSGPGGGDVIAELAPGGWADSPLRAATRPTAGEDAADKSPPDDLPVDVEREVRELVAACLWDVFSDNHDVRDADGRRADLGSHRGAAGFLADWLNAGLGHPPEDPEEQMRRMFASIQAFQDAYKSGDATAITGAIDAHIRRGPGGEPLYDYMNFYMGTRVVGDRADVSAVHRLIFRRLRGAGCDWTYRFPRIYVADLRPLRDALEEEKSADRPAWEYDPSESFAREQERDADDAVRDEELAEMRSSLEEGQREAVERAAAGPPPAIVSAYADVYGDFPDGWPPTAE